MTFRVFAQESRVLPIKICSYVKLTMLIPNQYLVRFGLSLAHAESCRLVMLKLQYSDTRYEAGVILLWTWKADCFLGKVN